MRILFICKHNRFRSKVAEAFFVNYNKNKENHVKSAGVMLDMLNMYVSPNVIKVLEEKGARVVNEKAQEVNEHLIKWADRIIIVADNVDKKIFDRENVFQWKIADISQSDIEGIRERVEKIEKKVKELIKKL
ncbi:hypothetical protein J4217_03100 [Candidatus Pacearchaeota archaeon]|nr:hypothetical protein [Candidatus Pacearchaeota archaeon]